MTDEATDLNLGDDLGIDVATAELDDDELTRVLEALLLGLVGGDVGLASAGVTPGSPIATPRLQTFADVAFSPIMA